MRQEYNRAMDKVCLSDEASERLEEMLEQQSQRSGPCRRRKWPLVLAVAVAALLMGGTALAMAYQTGVLDLLFQGDASELEPYVQTKLESAEDGNYRLTVDSSLFDGEVLYVIATVEGLNDQATERLMSGQVILDYLQSKWGPEHGKEWMEQGGWEPDLFQVRLERGNHVSTLAADSLPNPSEQSRSWILRMTLTGLHHPQTEPVTLRVNFMEEGSVVQIPVDQMPQVIEIPVQREALEEPSSGELLYVDRLELSPIRFTYVGRYPDALQYTLPVTFLMKDGQVLTCEELGLELAVCDVPGPDDVLGRELAEIVYTSKNIMDLAQIEAVILGEEEFSLAGN